MQVKFSSLNCAVVVVLTAVFSIMAGPGSFAQTADLQVRFLTFNVNFNNTTQEIRDDVQTVAGSGDILMFQEAKGVTIDNFLDGAWTVYQVVDQGDARRGSALAVRNTLVHSILNRGIVKGVDADGVEMLDRYILWMDVRFNNGQVLRVMTLHMPPQRFIEKQPPMADTFVSLANASPYSVVAGGDWNYQVTDDPYDILGRTGLIPRGVGIDGFYRDRSVVKFISITKLSALNVSSDHPPVQMATTVVAPTSLVGEWMVY